jgi:hypothetical protein
MELAVSCWQKASEALAMLMLVHQRFLAELAA